MYALFVQAQLASGLVHGMAESVTGLHKRASKLLRSSEAVQRSFSSLESRAVGSGAPPPSSSAPADKRKSKLVKGSAARLANEQTGTRLQNPADAAAPSRRQAWGSSAATFHKSPPRGRRDGLAEAPGPLSDLSLQAELEALLKGLKVSNRRHGNLKLG